MIIYKNPIAEKPDGKPQYMTGDIFLTKRWGVAMVIAGVSKVSGWPPAYTANAIEGYPSDKNSWWYAGAWERVILGPLHYITNQWPDGVTPPDEVGIMPHVDVKSMLNRKSLITIQR